MIFSIIAGAVVGYIAGKIMDTHLSWIMNILVGMLGSFVGSFLFGLIGFHTTGIASFIVAIIGACICIALARKIR
ncbi:MAG: GlsB/YeaQ/YmgE family stress response membrane protein [Ruminococcaceae bacterium]|nr:GlsB/YeaQ/YmgE family stress response membrane protein [Oscillospiraceae bacterium]